MASTGFCGLDVGRLAGVKTESLFLHFMFFLFYIDLFFLVDSKLRMSVDVPVLFSSALTG